MKNQMMNKLRSNQGASVVLALLLFLVCAVVGSIVLTAATVSAGRMSKLVEMDQRYYCVTSAADLLCGQLNGKKIRVERFGPPNERGKYTPLLTELDDQGKPKAVTVSNSDYIALQTLSVLYNKRELTWADITLPPNMSSMEIAVKDGEDELSELKASVSVSPLSDADHQGLVFTIANQPAPYARDQTIYQLKVTCTADVLKEVVPSESGDIATYTVTWAITEVGK